MRNMLIYGAGEAGVMVLNEIRKHSEENIKVLGFLDDDKEKIGKEIMGVRVFGGKLKLKVLVKNLRINEIIIAMPSISKVVIKDIVRICMKEKIKLLIVPSTMEIIDGTVRFDQIKKLDLSDLLDREEVLIDSGSIREYIEGKRILITGASGSIGSELVKQVLTYNPGAVILVDIYENGLFYLMKIIKEKELHKKVRILPVVSDIKNSSLMEELFFRCKPDIVFHAAAYKHVPLMEDQRRVIFLNNVVGTLNVLRLSLECGVKRFIGISTDKAVYPVSVMGKTKRISELLTTAYSYKGLGSCSVRFGNVLGTNGSVVTVFEEQIGNGGPVTITSPRMERYFMTVKEAVSLVLQAGSMEGNGDIYVLDMGKPIKIKDLAENMIILSGLTPDVDIKIDYTGIRSGEKFSEELFYRGKEVYESNYKGIYIETSIVDDSLILDKTIYLAENIYSIKEIEIQEVVDELIDLHSDPLPKEITI